ncbi:MAG: HDOD domain-containing protein [Acidobacteriota bacterium]
MASSVEYQEYSARLQEIERQVGDLPVLPAAAMEALRRMEGREVSAAELQQVIARDQALGAQILRYANSALYCFQGRVSSLSHAIAVMGFDALRALLVGAAMKRFFASDDMSRCASALRPLWYHSWGAALAAKAVARACRYSNVDEALTGGLVHDLGKLVMLRNHSGAYRQIIDRVTDGNTTFCEVETASFGFTHAQVGALLALKWYFPPSLVRAILHHHEPIILQGQDRLTAIVSLANRITVLYGVGYEADDSPGLGEEPSARALGLGEKELEGLLAEIRDLFSGVPELDGAGRDHAAGRRVADA